MSETILINVMPQEVRVGVVQNGTLQELHIERSGGRGLVGDICLGRVTRVLPGMQSAFVDIGLERDSFLYVSDFFDEEDMDDVGGGEERKEPPPPPRISPRPGCGRAKPTRWRCHAIPPDVIWCASCDRCSACQVVPPDHSGATSPRTTPTV